MLRKGRPILTNTITEGKKEAGGNIHASAALLALDTPVPVSLGLSHLWLESLSQQSPSHYQSPFFSGSDSPTKERKRLRPQYLGYVNNSGWSGDQADLLGKNQSRITLFDPEKKVSPKVFHATHMNAWAHVPNLITIYFTYLVNRAKVIAEIQVGVGSVL